MFSGQKSNKIPGTAGKTLRGKSPERRGSLFIWSFSNSLSFMPFEFRLPIRLIRTHAPKRLAAGPHVSSFLPAVSHFISYGYIVPVQSSQKTHTANKPAQKNCGGRFSCLPQHHFTLFFYLSVQHFLINSTGSSDLRRGPPCSRG